MTPEEMKEEMRRRGVEAPIPDCCALVKRNDAVEPTEPKRTIGFPRAGGMQSYRFSREGDWHVIIDEQGFARYERFVEDNPIEMRPCIMDRVDRVTKHIGGRQHMGAVECY